MERSRTTREDCRVLVFSHRLRTCAVQQAQGGEAGKRGVQDSDGTCRARVSKPEAAALPAEPASRDARVLVILEIKAGFIARNCVLQANAWEGRAALCIQHLTASVSKIWRTCRIWSSSASLKSSKVKLAASGGWVDGV